MVRFVLDLDLFFTSSVGKIFPLLFISIGLGGYVFCFLDRGAPIFRGLVSFFIDQWGYRQVLHTWMSYASYTFSLSFSYYVDLRMLSWVPEYIGY